MEEWIRMVADVGQGELMRLALEKGVQAIIRRVHRRPEGAAPHSGAGPTPASPPKGTETPVTVTDDSTTGAALAESLLQGVGNERVRAATRLLGAHRGGYWLRRLLDEETELAAAADRPVIDRSGTHPSVDWDAIGLLMLSRPAVFKSSRSELAVLEVAASLVSRCAVQLGAVVQAVDDTEFRLILRAMTEAAYGDGAADRLL